MTHRIPFLLDEETLASAHGVGEAIHALVRDLYPICRSITGDGLRETLARMHSIAPLAVTEVPSGTKVFDWAVPNEWNVAEAYIENSAGHRVVDFRDSNLHLVSYSTPIDAAMTLAELRPHLHSLPEYPDWIPYRTTYYNPNWGFCLTDRVARALPEDRYHAVIQAKFAPGSMTIAEHLHRGSSSDEVLIFAHTCHPSLCNDNLSGLSVAMHLARFLANRQTRLSYRFVFAPATIGSITWLALNEDRLGCIRHGLVLSLLGDPGPLHYKRSRGGGHTIDRAAMHVMRTMYSDAKVLDFSPWGYDERQFGSPGINLPVGRLTRTPNGEFPQYHTSADDPSFVEPQALGDSWLACLRIFEVLENEAVYLNTSPKGEPQLGRRGLYRRTGGFQDIPERQFALLWILNQSDGRTSLLDIADRSGLPFHVIAAAAEDLRRTELLAPVPRPGEDGPR